MTPDPWQSQVLSSQADQSILCCCRSSGKSTVAASLAVREAVLRPRSLVLILSPSERQSGETALKAWAFFEALGRPVAAVKQTELQLHLANGSRVIALPGTEKTVRGYNGARLLIVDEASRVDDALYFTVRPMLSVSRGRLLAMSTPFGQRGWFYEAWERGRNWRRVEVKADRCPRISAEFLADERQAMGNRWFNQEYCCSFEAAVDAVFDPATVRAALSDELQPLWG